MHVNLLDRQNMLCLEGSHSCTILPGHLRGEPYLRLHVWQAPNTASICARREQLRTLRCSSSSSDMLRCSQPGASTSGRTSAWQTRDRRPQHSIRGSRVTTAAEGDSIFSKPGVRGALDRAKDSLAKRQAGPTAGKRKAKAAPKGTRVRQADKPKETTPYQGVKPVHFAGREEVQKVGAGRLSKVREPQACTCTEGSTRMQPQCLHLHLCH